MEVLVIGFGNPGRVDDGLGPALAEHLSRLGIPGLSVESDYQLTVEDAHVVSGYDVVVFADADVSGPEPFYFRRLEAGDPSVGFTSHDVTPQEVMGLAKELFAAKTEAYILGIRGYEFNEFGERLSEDAGKNLAAALAFIEHVVRNRSFSSAAGAGSESDNEQNVYYLNMNEISLN